MPITGDTRQPIAFPAARDGGESLPAAWREFIRYCRDLRFGEIERLSIQDGLPVLAEVTRKKVKFDRRR
jgi:hypothetical protein